MNYQKHYDTLVNRGKNRTLEGYKERHHIIPRCMGGTDSKENLVELTASEHYVAHQLLVKIYPDTPGLIFAAKLMSSKLAGRNNKSYEWLRKLAAKAHGDRTRGIKRPPRTSEWSNNISKSKMGIPLSEETKRKLSLAHLGKEKSAEMKINMSLAASNRTKEHQDKLNASHTGKKRKPETIDKLRAVALRQIEITCPHCGKTGKPRGMRCWHFDRCKENPHGIQR